jgi:hypothetical protein
MFFLGAAPEAVLRIAGFAAEGIAAAVVGAESGDLGRAVPFPLAGALRNGDGDWDRGVAAREGGLEGRLIVGLSQEEKKSSSLSPAGVLVPSLADSGMSVITTSSGYLRTWCQCCSSRENRVFDILSGICSTAPL